MTGKQEIDNNIRKDRKMIKAVIFDLDGTLLYTLEDLADAMNYTLRRFNMPERTLDEVRRFVGNGIRKLIRRAVPAETTEETVDECLSASSLTMMSIVWIRQRCMTACLRSWRSFTTRATSWR